MFIDADISTNQYANNTSVQGIPVNMSSNNENLNITNRLKKKQKDYSYGHGTNLESICCTNNTS